MKLSLVERMLMVQNFEILARLNPEEAEQYERKIEVLRYGFELLYDDLAEEFVKGDTVVTEEEGMYVLSVLSMYDGLTHIVQDQQITVPEDVWFPFPGFYGNEEMKEFVFAMHLNKDGRWDALTRDGEIPDSHMPTKDTYSRMLSVLNGMKPRGPGPLTEEQVLQVLRASGPQHAE